MRYNSLTVRAAIGRVVVGAAVSALLAATSGCNKQDRKAPVDPFADADEVVRIDARRQVKYPTAIKESDEAFYLVTSPNPSGTPISGAQWLYIDYTTTSFDNRFIGSSVADSAKLYRQWSSDARYVSQLKKNDAETLGEELYKILQKCRAGEHITVGMSAKAGNATGMWKSSPNESVIATLVLARAIEDPEAEEKSLIRSYIEKHPGFSKQDEVYKKIIQEGKGKKVPDNGRVYCKYGVFFLDGSLLETNDAAIAARYGREIPKNRTNLLPFGVKNDGAVVKGLSGVCVGEPIGTQFEVVMSSALAYGAKGKGSVRPYEPLRFEITIVNHTAN